MLAFLIAWPYLSDKRCSRLLSEGVVIMAAASARGRDKIDPKVLRSALVLIVGFLGVIFDTTIVSVALHTLAAQLHTPVSTIQWVTTGYLLALGMAVPLSTWALRRFGGKRLWMFALAVFLVGSIGSS